MKLLTFEERDEINTLYTNGLSRAAVAREVGRAGGSIEWFINKYVKTGMWDTEKAKLNLAEIQPGPIYHNRGRSFSEDEKFAVDCLMRMGVQNRDIAKILSRSMNSVTNYI